MSQTWLMNDVIREISYSMLHNRHNNSTSIRVKNIIFSNSGKIWYLYIKFVLFAYSIFRCFAISERNSILKLRNVDLSQQSRRPSLGWWRVESWRRSQELSVASEPVEKWDGSTASASLPSPPPLFPFLSYPLPSPSLPSP